MSIDIQERDAVFKKLSEVRDKMARLEDKENIVELKRDEANKSGNKEEKNKLEKELKEIFEEHNNEVNNYTRCMMKIRELSGIE